MTDNLCDDNVLRDQLRWLILNGQRLGWFSENSPYNKFYSSLLSLEGDRASESDFSTVITWTSGRIAEGYAFMLESYEDKGSSWRSLEVLGEIKSKIMDFRG